MFTLAFDFRHTIRILITSAVLAAIICSPFLFLELDSNNLGNENLLIGILSFPYALMIAHSFHFAYQLDNRIQVRYTSLFYAVWNTIPLLIISIIFTLIAKLLIWLTGTIFSTFKFTAIADFLSNDQHFWIISTVCLCITGIGIARQNLTILDNFRLVILKLFYYLYPFLCAISSFYVILYLYTAFLGQAPDGSSVIFLFLSILGIIFFNAIFQDGEIQSNQTHTLQLLLRSYRVLLFIITLLTAYLFYPLSKQIANALLLLGILVLYGLAYGVSAFLAKHASNQWVKSANIIISIFYLICYLVINNPYNPLFHNQLKTPLELSLTQSRQVSVYNQFSPALKKLIKNQDNRLKNLGLNWRDPTNHIKPVMNLCRAHVHSFGWLIGIIDKNQCLIATSSRTFREKNYQVLSGDPSILTWQPSKNAIALTLGGQIYIDRVQLQTICRGKINNKYHVGTLYGYNCVVSKHNKPVPLYNEFEILTVDASNYPQKMELLLDVQLEERGLKFTAPPVNNLFVAGINAKGNIGICRGLYQKGLQIGNYKDNQCTIGYGGKAFALTNYSVLTSVDTKPKVQWLPMQFRGINIPDENLTLGYEILGTGSMRQLQACRGIYDNAIHIGKVLNAQCNIAVGKKELILNNGMFTSLQPSRNTSGK